MKSKKHFGFDAIMDTEKHFEFIAAIIHSAKRGASAYCLALIADAKFKSDNPDFDSEKFLKDCGVELKPEKGTAVPLPPELKREKVLHRAGQTLREAGYNNLC